MNEIFVSNAFADSRFSNASERFSIRNLLVPRTGVSFVIRHLSEATKTGAKVFLSLFGIRHSSLERSGISKQASKQGLSF